MWTGAAALFCLASCSTQAWYEGARQSAEAECRKQPPAAQESCRASVNQTPYGKYEQERAREQK